MTDHDERQPPAAPEDPPAGQPTGGDLLRELALDRRWRLRRDDVRPLRVPGAAPPEPPDPLAPPQPQPSNGTTPPPPRAGWAAATPRLRRPRKDPAPAAAGPGPASTPQTGPQDPAASEPAASGPRDQAASGTESPAASSPSSTESPAASRPPAATERPGPAAPRSRRATARARHAPEPRPAEPPPPPPTNPAAVPGLCILVGALPGCGTTRAAVARARAAAGHGLVTCLVDANPERPGVAWHTIGRHLDPVTERDWAWWGARDPLARAARIPGEPPIAALLLPPGLGTPFSPVPEPWYPAPDLTIRWEPGGSASVEVLCRPATPPSSVLRVLGAVAEGCRAAPRVTATADGLSDSELAAWEHALGIPVQRRRRSAADRLAEALDELARLSPARFDALVIDLGSPPPIGPSGAPDPRIAWAAQASGGHVTVVERPEDAVDAHGPLIAVSRPDPMARDAAGRLLAAARAAADTARRLTALAPR